MRRKWVIGASLAAAAIGGLLGMVGKRIVGDASGPPAERFAYQTASAASTFWDVPAFKFSNQHGIATERADLLGHVWIADFMFTTCTSACPVLTSKLVKLQRKLSDPTLRFVSFSVDPEHDTQAALLAYSQLWNPNEMRWSLLRTSPSTLAELARDMRVAVEPQDDVKDPILHSSLFFLVDVAGAVRGIYDSADDIALGRLQQQTRELLNSPGVPVPLAAQTGPELLSALQCNACHSNVALAPPLTGLRGRNVALQDGTQVLVDRAYLLESIVAPGAKQVAGFLNLMPSYRDELSDAQLERLVEYLETLGAASADRAESPSTVTAPREIPTQASASGKNSVALPSALMQDPVCAMDVRVTAQTPHVHQDGKDYYFCSDVCRSQFAAAPTRFLRPSPAP